MMLTKEELAALLATRGQKGSGSRDRTGARERYVRTWLACRCAKTAAAECGVTAANIWNAIGTYRLVAEYVARETKDAK